jgi:sensor domain CHASE-containing protein
MNKKQKIIIPTIIALFLLCVIAWYRLSKDAFTAGNEERQLIDNLNTLIESYLMDEIDSIDIVSITPFEWDKMYFFEGYSTPEYIDQV